MTQQETLLDAGAKRLAHTLRKDPNFHSIGIGVEVIPHFVLYLKGKLEIGKYPVTWEDHPVWVKENNT